MNCAWCGADDDGSDSHGICDACMSAYFGVNPESIHEEITDEEKGGNEPAGQPDSHSTPHLDSTTPSADKPAR